MSYSSYLGRCRASFLDFGQCWASLGKFEILGEFWASLGHFGQFWASLVSFGRVWATLCDFGYPGMGEALAGPYELAVGDLGP